MSGRRSLTTHLQNKRASTGTNTNTDGVPGSGSLLVNSPTANKRNSTGTTSSGSLQRTSQSDNKVVLIDSSSDSLTVTWPHVNGAVRYVLEYRRNKAGYEYKVLSDKLTKTQIRKKNLSGASGYYFRVGAITERNKPNATPKFWMTHSLPFKLLGHHEFQMDAPHVSPAIGSFQTLLVSWKRSSMKGCMFQYELQMREFKGGAPWITIASNLGGTFVKKKNLTSTNGYQFRVRPIRMENPMTPMSPNPYSVTGRDRPFSPPSEPIVAKGFSAGLQRWFEQLQSTTLLKYKSTDDQDYLEQVPIAESLGGKEFVLLFVSSMTNPKCQDFTSKLLKWYNSLTAKTPAEYEDVGAINPLEVVLISVDPNEEDFQGQFGEQPWLAIDYEEDARKDILDRLSVNMNNDVGGEEENDKGGDGDVVDEDDIPRLVVLNGDTGSILVDNFVDSGDVFNVTTIKKWRELATQENPMDVIFDVDDQEGTSGAYNIVSDGDDENLRTSVEFPTTTSKIKDDVKEAKDSSNLHSPLPPVAVETTATSSSKDDDENYNDNAFNSSGNYISSSSYNINFNDSSSNNDGNENLHNSINIFNMNPSELKETPTDDSLANLGNSSRAMLYDMTVELVDATSDTLTITWPAAEGATRYILEYRTSDSMDFTLLSDKLTKPKVRKRNLSGNVGFVFRVLAVVGNNDDSGHLDDSVAFSTNSATVGMWMTHSEPFCLLTKQEGLQQLSSPIVTKVEKEEAVVVSWKAGSGGKRSSKKGPIKTYYELQMREDVGGKPWHTVSRYISSCEFKKTDLKSPLGYQFRVRLNGDEQEEKNVFPFSKASDVIVAKARLSEAMKKKFDSLSSGTFVKKNSSGDGTIEAVQLEDALAGKEFVLLYIAAYWSDPCKEFTGKLVKWYESLDSSAGDVEVVFISCDRGRQGFVTCLESQPWLAVDFDDAARDRLLDSYQGSDINSVPRLVVLNAETGKVVVKNAADGKPLKSNVLEKWRLIDDSNQTVQKGDPSTPPSSPGNNAVKAKVPLSAPTSAGNSKKKKKVNVAVPLSTGSKTKKKLATPIVPTVVPDLAEDGKLSVAMQKTFKCLKQRTLIKRDSQDPVSLEDALGNKEFVLLYAAENKSGTCNQFTRRLAKYYESFRKRPFEIVLISCDDNQQSFDIHLQKHPWMAVEYKDGGREKLLSKIVTMTNVDDFEIYDVPVLMLLNASTGKVLVRNVADDESPLDATTLAKWRKLAGLQPVMKKKQRNKAVPAPSSPSKQTTRQSSTRTSLSKPTDKKRPSTTSNKKSLPSAMKRLFESLDDGTFRTSSDSKQATVSLSDALLGKEFVLLYATSNTTPNGLGFTADLADWYGSLDVTEKSKIEVIFLSCDTTAKGYLACFESHPWLAIDYDDTGREKMLKIIKQEYPTTTAAAESSSPESDLLPRLVVLHAKTGKVVVDTPSRQDLTEATTIHKWRSVAEKFKSKRLSTTIATGTPSTTSSQQQPQQQAAVR